MLRLKRPPTPVLLMAAVLLAAGVSGLVRRGVALPRVSLRTAPLGPDDTVLAAFDAAKKGDSRRYLDLFADRMLTDLQHTAQEMGDAKFRAYLLDTTKPVKGVVLSDHSSAGEGRIRVRVEFVYAEKNDLQFYTLRPEGKAWRICDISTAERVQPPVPYGTEASPLGGQ